jgi:hypothetical protein
MHGRTRPELGGHGDFLRGIRVIRGLLLWWQLWWQLLWLLLRGDSARQRRAEWTIA